MSGRIVETIQQKTLQELVIIFNLDKNEKISITKERTNKFFSAEIYSFLIICKPNQRKKANKISSGKHNTQK